MAVIDVLDPDTVDIWIKATLKASSAAMTAYKGRFRESAAVPAGWAAEGPYVTWSSYEERSFDWPAGPGKEICTHRDMIYSVRVVRAFEGGQIQWRAFKTDFQLLRNLLCGVECVPVLGESNTQIGVIRWARKVNEIKNEFKDGDVQLAERGVRIRVTHS